MLNKTLGYFREQSTRNTFPVYDNHEYNSGSFSSDFPHVIIVSHNPINDSGMRYAKVLNTVMYVVIDEDASGMPVIEKWNGKLLV